MGRLVPHGDEKHREFLLIELKRPSLTIGRKELDQLEDYVNSILAQPDFVNTSTNWNFYLVTSEYDGVVKQRITQENRAAGLFIDKPNHKVWVKSWAELLTARDAMQMNYKVIFIADGNATNTDAEHNATLNNMVRLFADVMTTEELLGFLRSSSAAREAAE
jgi:Isochorismatase family